MRALNDPFSVREIGQGRFRLSATTADFLGLASTVTGLLASRGISILSGSIRTGGPRSLAASSFVVEPSAPVDWTALGGEFASAAESARSGNLARVRNEIHARLIEYLRRGGASEDGRLYPIDLKISQSKSSEGTIIDITSQDTPAFLYELTNALAMLGINISRMEIRTTQKGVVRDRLWVTNEAGQKITQKSRLRAIQWAVLLMKQFTHLLPSVPDPASALEKIASFGKQIFEHEDFDNILLTLKKSQALEGMSKMFGSSLFLWEEFIRLQHGPIIGILGDRRVLSGRKAKGAMRRELARKLKAAPDFYSKVSALNEFKDREMFRIDLRHLLGKTSYLQEFAEEFTDLSETVVAAAHELAWARALKKYAAPLTAPGRRSRDAVFALGKFGGRELGYASDLELLFVYDDAPENSPQAAKNGRFYEELVSVFCGVIRARNEGVFEIDTRLRPYGKQGPAAASWNLFRKYYSSTGKAANFERQALVKLRAIAGSAKLGAAAERARDEFVYSGKPFNFKEAFELRERQRKELVKPGETNAKYGAGGLLDVEYAVQAMQIVHGRRHGGDVRSANTIKALEALAASRVIDAETKASLESAYVFLREAINALRIFRGNARDLAIPDAASREFVVLARRMGYEGSDDAVRRELKRDLERHLKKSADLYKSVMRDLENDESKHAGDIGVQPETFLWIDIDELASGNLNEAGVRMLETCGFGDVPAALARLRALHGGDPLDEFREAINSSWAQWQHAADPDAALERLERLAAAVPDRRAFWRAVADSDKKLSVLLTIFGSSAYLTEVLFADPGTLHETVAGRGFELADADKALRAFARGGAPGPKAARAFRHRQTLRLALAEIGGKAELEDVFARFSDLADEIVRRMLRETAEGEALGVVALGKWGGRELNFSSDLDLMFVADAPKYPIATVRRIHAFLDALAAGGPAEFLYRVDLRLRPRGTLGSLFQTSASALEYYKEEAEPWERQSLLKARAVGPSAGGAARLVEGAMPLIYAKRLAPAAVASLRAVKRRYEDAVKSRGESATDVKIGPGGIRDVEFAAQFLQLKHGRRLKALREPNTFRALAALRRAKLLPERDCEILSEGLAFLRRIENRLQLKDNEQVFNVPRDPKELRKLAKSLAFFDTPAGQAEDRFSAELQKTKRECRAIFEKVFYGR